VPIKREFDLAKAEFGKTVVRAGKHLPAPLHGAHAARAASQAPPTRAPRRLQSKPIIGAPGSMNGVDEDGQ